MNVYAWLIGAGASLGLYALARQVSEKESQQWLLSGLWTLVCTLVGARLAFVILHQTYFSSHGSEIFRMIDGGLWWAGAVAGWWVGIFTTTLIWQGKFTRVLGALYPIIPPLSVMTWLACGVSGCAYGGEMPVSCALGVWVQIQADLSYRFPLFFLAALSLLILFLLFDRRMPAGLPKELTAAGGYLLFGLHLCLFTALRQDQNLLPNGQSLDLLIAFIFAGLMLLLNAILWLIYRLKSK